MWIPTDHRDPCSWQRTGTAGCCVPARWSSAQPRHHDRCLHLRNPDRPCRRTLAGSFSVRWKRKGEDTGERPRQSQSVNNNLSDNSYMKDSAHRLCLLNCSDFEIKENKLTFHQTCNCKCFTDFYWAYAHSTPSQCQRSPSTAQAWGPHQWGCGHKHATWSHSAQGFSVTQTCQNMINFGLPIHQMSTKSNHIKIHKWKHTSHLKKVNY